MNVLQVIITVYVTQIENILKPQSTHGKGFFFVIHLGVKSSNFLLVNIRHHPHLDEYVNEQQKLKWWENSS